MASRPLRPDFGKALRQLRPRQSPQKVLFQLGNPVHSLAHQLAVLKSRTVSPVMTEDAIEGTEEVTPLGRHLVVHSTRNEDHYHGKVRLSRFSSEELDRLCSLFKRKPGVPSRE